MKIDSPKISIINTDAENKMTQIEYMENSNGKIILIQEWVNDIDLQKYRR